MLDVRLIDFALSNAQTPVITDGATSGDVLQLQDGQLNVRDCTATRMWSGDEDQFGGRGVFITVSATSSRALAQLVVHRVQSTGFAVVFWVEVGTAWVSNSVSTGDAITILTTPKNFVTAHRCWFLDQAGLSGQFELEGVVRVMLDRAPGIPFGTYARVRVQRSIFFHHRIGVRIQGDTDRLAPNYPTHVEVLRCLFARRAPSEVLVPAGGPLATADVYVAVQAPSDWASDALKEIHVLLRNNVHFAPHCALRVNPFHRVQIEFVFATVMYVSELVRPPTTVGGSAVRLEAEYDTLADQAGGSLAVCNSYFQSSDSNPEGGPVLAPGYPACLGVAFMSTTLGTRHPLPQITLLGNAFFDYRVGYAIGQFASGGWVDAGGAYQASAFPNLYVNPSWPPSEQPVVAMPPLYGTAPFPVPIPVEGSPLINAGYPIASVPGTLAINMDFRGLVRSGIPDCGAIEGIDGDGE